jgi:MFS superfamily sulfate permease-like transporter
MAELRFLKINVRASSIVEVSVALVIISFVFGIAATIFMRVEQSAFSARKFAAGVALDKVFEETRASVPAEEQVYEAGEMLIFQTAEKYKDNKDLLVVRLEARDDNGKVIAERKYLVYETASE